MLATVGRRGRQAARGRTGMNPLAGADAAAPSLPGISSSSGHPRDLHRGGTRAFGAASLGASSFAPSLSSAGAVEGSAVGASAADILVLPRPPFGIVPFPR